jgi:hypothetical protein
LARQAQTAWCCGKRFDSVTPTRVAFVVLKCALREYSDNLGYEYLIGKRFLNAWTSRLPCIPATFGLYVAKPGYLRELVEQVRATEGDASAFDPVMG